MGRAAGVTSYLDRNKVQPVKPVDKPRRQAQILHLEKWKMDHLPDVTKMIEAPVEERLTREERKEIAEFEIWMDRIGQAIAIFAVVSFSVLLWVNAFRGFGQ